METHTCYWYSIARTSFISPGLSSASMLRGSVNLQGDVCALVPAKTDAISFKSHAEYARDISVPPNSQNTPLIVLTVRPRPL